MSVYTETIFVRLLLAAACLAATLVIGIAGVTVLRFATDLAIPGWATTMVASLAVLLMQTVVLVVVTALMVLSARSARPIVPLVDCRTFIAGTDTVPVRTADAGERAAAHRA